MGLLILRSAVSPTPETFPLAIHADGRYLVDAQGAPFQIRGDTAWGIFGQLTVAEATAYFEDRAAKGVNTVLCSIVENFYSDDPPNNVDGERPFSSGMTPDTASGYWQHADAIVQAAKDNGICILCCIYLGFGDDGLWPIASAVNQASRVAFGEFLGARYRSYGNFIWLGGGDRNLDLTSEQDIVNDFMTGIKNEWPEVVTGLHGNRDDDQRERFATAFASWLEIFPIYTYEAGAAPADAAEFYGDSPVAPVYFMEGPYENEINGGVERTRILPVQAILNGAIAGEVFGNNPIWPFNADSADIYYDGPTPKPDWTEVLDSVGALGLAARNALFDSVEWWKLDTATLITSALGTGDSQKAGAVASDGSFGIAVVPTATATTVDLSLFSGPNVRIRWYDPIAGTYTAVDTYTASGTQSVSHPGNNSDGDSDWLMVLDSVA